MKRYFTLAITTLTFALAVQGGVANAQQKAPAPATPPAAGQALEIGPPVITLTGDPGQTVQAKVNLRDVSPNKLIVSNEINDFVAAGEDGTPKLLLKQGETSPYSMKEWIVPLPKFTLVPKQVQTLTVTVKIPKNAAPGGYYSVIRFSGTPPGLEGTGVSLSASIGALVFMRVNGEAKELMSIAEFSAVHQTREGDKQDWLFESLPIKFIERIKNEGNLHEQPTGQVTITDMFGKVVGSIPVNQAQRNVLPGSIRKFDQSLDDKAVGGKFLFGKYTAKMEVAYGSSVEMLGATTTFWVIPYKLIALIVVAIIALGTGIYFFFRWYNRRLLEQTRRHRR